MSKRTIKKGFQTELTGKFTVVVGRRLRATGASVQSEPVNAKNKPKPAPHPKDAKAFAEMLLEEDAVIMEILAK